MTRWSNGRPVRWWLGCLIALIVLAAFACAGDGAATVAPKPQQPAPAAQPALAAPASEPQPAAPVPVVPAPRAAPRPAAPAAATPKYGGTLRVGAREDFIGNWDPMRFGFLLHYTSAPLYGDGSLVKSCLTDVYAICGELAEKWESNADFTQWTFKIRDGVRWHDGKPFTAEDAKFWVDLSVFGAKAGERTRPEDRLKADFGEVQKVEVLEGNRVRITLASPHPFMLSVLGKNERNIAHPRHLMQPRIEKGDVLVTIPEIGWVATGPFKMDRYEKGSLARFVRNDLYWVKDGEGRQLPYLEVIENAFINDPGALDAAFRVGRLDIGSSGTGFLLTPERRERYVRDLGDQVWFLETKYVLHGLGFNAIRSGPLQDARVRRAISLWLDKQGAINSVLGGVGVQYGLYFPTSPWSNPDLKSWPGINPATREADRAEAKRLLAEAGYANGFSGVIMGMRAWLPRMEFVNAQLAGLNIDAKITPLDAAAHLQRQLTGDFAFAFATTSQLFPEAGESIVTRHSISNGAHTKHEDPKVAELFDRLRRVRTAEERVKLAREIERYIILEQAYVVPLFGEIAVIAHRSHVKGIVVPDAYFGNSFSRSTVWLDR